MILPIRHQSKARASARARVVLGLALVVLVLPAVALAAAWTTVSSDAAGPVLNGVDAISSNDIWAVGQGRDYQTYTRHWNGSSWMPVVTPAVPGALLSTLNDVSAVATNDVWAVGDNQSGTALALHWNGTSWTRATLPALTGYSSLQSVSARAANDVWAVGQTNTSKTLALHWNGTSWSVVPTPSPSTTTIPYNFLNAVYAMSANDVWAVGRYSRKGKYPQTLVLRWDGVRWRQVPSPNAAGPNGFEVYNDLRSVSGTSANDVWAVGTVGNQTLAMRWNGSAWSLVPAPNVPDRQNFLNDVDAVSANDVWAVGASRQIFYSGDNEIDYNSTLIEHWNGFSWTIVPSPNPIQNASELRASTVVSATDIWAAGSLGITLRYRP